MPENRFYYKSIPEPHQTLLLEKEEFKHLQVMRPRPGDTVEIIDGEGHLAIAFLKHLGKHQAELTIQEKKAFPKPPFELVIAQAIPRPNRLDILLEKGTELGMTKLILFPGELSEKTSLTPDQLQRKENILTSALKQCGSLFRPKLELWEPLAQWKPLPYPAFFGDLRKEAPYLATLWKKQSALFVIGPEKGLTPNEIAHLQQLGAQGVKLHPNILRTDTAPLAALALISHLNQI